MQIFLKSFIFHSFCSSLISSKSASTQMGEGAVKQEVDKHGQGEGGRG